VAGVSQIVHAGPFSSLIANYAAWHSSNQRISSAVGNQTTTRLATMMKRITLCLLFFPAFTSAQTNANNCDSQQMKNQQEDAATIQRLEIAWTEAYLRADTVFMGCLLAPDFTEIMRTGEVKRLSDELAMAEKNRGKGLKMSEPPKIQVLLHDNVAIAFGHSIGKGANGKTQSRWYSDVYLWKDGKWHAFFAQQTAAVVP
jgi:hypothetical protein